MCIHYIYQWPARSSREIIDLKMRIDNMRREDGKGRRWRRLNIDNKQKYAGPPGWSWTYYTHMRGERLRIECSKTRLELLLNPRAGGNEDLARGWMTIAEIVVMYSRRELRRRRRRRRRGNEGHILFEWVLWLKPIYLIDDDCVRDAVNSESVGGYQVVRMSCMDVFGS